jgi:hypothetical protein
VKNEIWLLVGVSVLLYLLAGLFGLLVDYVPFFSPLVSLGFIVGLPVAVLVWLWRNLT